MTVGERIKARRKELGLSADDLAVSLGVSRSTIFRYESNYIEKFPVNALSPIASALHTSVSFLLGWDDSHPVTVEVTPSEELLLSRYRKASQRDRAIVDTILSEYDSQ